eukprot:5315691-Ditylum_brightwellii.AAC.1
MHKYERDEFYSAQQNKEGRGGLVTSNCENGFIYYTDDVGFLKGVGKKTKKMLASILSIENIDDFKHGTHLKT